MRKKTKVLIKCKVCKKEFWVIKCRESAKYCSHKCRAVAHGKIFRGENHPMYGIHRFRKDSANWKGGKTTSSGGYILIHQPSHPFSSKAGYVRESRIVVEKQIKRYLFSKEIVHHLNEIKNDDRIENLMVFKNKPYHRWFHKRGYCNPKGIIFDGRKI